MFDAFAAEGKQPDNAAALSWDATMISIAALNGVAPDATAAQVREYLSGMKGYASVTGVYDMPAIPQRGIGLSSVVMTQWDGTAANWTVVSHPAGAPL